MRTKRKQKLVEPIANKRNSMNKEEAATKPKIMKADIVKEEATKEEAMKVEMMKEKDTATSTTMEEVDATGETPVDLFMKKLLPVILPINVDQWHSLVDAIISMRTSLF